MKFKLKKTKMIKNNIITFVHVFFVFIIFIFVSCRNYKENPVDLVKGRKPSENPYFVTTWKITDVKGLPSEKKIIIPINPNYVYDYNIKWYKTDNPSVNGEKLNNRATTIINFPSAGEYNVEIIGTFPAIFFGEIPGKDEAGTQYRHKIKNIKNWGNIEWESMEGAFAECAELTINTNDTPDLSKVKSMKNMFYGVVGLTANLNNWDVSNVVNMGGVFFGTRYFNQPLNNWDVSNVTDMSYMFFGNRSFNQPLDNWNVSRVTDMKYMFFGTIFNQNIGNWRVSNVNYMDSMFSESAFNSPIDSWDVSNVTDMKNMFNKATFFNQPLNSWNVSNVTDMSSMFQKAVKFNKSLNDWNLNENVDLKYMFLHAVSFDQQNVNKWKLENIKKEKKQGMFGE